MKIYQGHQNNCVSSPFADNFILKQVFQTYKHLINEILVRRVPLVLKFLIMVLIYHGYQRLIYLLRSETHNGDIRIVKMCDRWFDKVLPSLITLSIFDVIFIQSNSTRLYVSNFTYLYDLI